jgi:predicted acyl esterase
VAYSPGAAAPAEVQVRRDILIPLSSGAELAADLYLPAGGGPAPALMTYLPYLKDGMAGASYDHANRFFPARGLGRVCLFGPDEEGGQGEGAEVVGGGLVVAGG